MTTSARSSQHLSAEDAAMLTVDGVAPRLRVSPTTPEDVAAALSMAISDGLAVIPRGGGTHMDVGNPPQRADLVLDMSHLSGIVAYTAEELTAVMLAGTPLDEAQAVFGAQGQWLALDPPHSATSTVGGLLASNASGPHRLRYGTARDLVLGMHVAYADATPTLAKSGARVVKSVAGYDLHKAHIGALGTLGVMVEINVRLHPLPPQRGVIVCPVPTPDIAGAIARTLLRKPLTLGALELLNDAALRRLNEDLTQRGAPTLPVAGLAVLALCEGHASVVTRQRDEVARAAQQVGASCADGLLPATPSCVDALANLVAPHEQRQTVLAVGVPLSRVTAAFTMVSQHIAPVDQQAQISARLGSGLVHAVLAVPSGHLGALIAALRHDLAALGGHLVVRHAPTSDKAGLDVWGPMQAPALMRRLKDALDPTHLLNPGRFVQGIDDRVQR